VLDVALPTVHTAPADLSVGRETLAVFLGDVARLAKRVGDLLRVPGRILRPLARTRRRIDPDDAVLADADVAKLLGDPARFADLRQETLPLVVTPHPRPAARRRPDRCHDRADDEFPGSNAIREPIQIVVGRIDAGVRI